MTRFGLLAMLWLAWGAAFGADDPAATKSKPIVTKADHSYGTALQWEKDMEVAAKKAERDKKLLLVLAVAGYFDDPSFT